MTKSIAVVGGTGFLGSRICREAALRGMNVVSLSRSAPSASLLAHHWAEKVEWRAADVLAPPVDGQAPEWKSLLEGRDAVVHCVGQLLADASYKDALRRGDTAKLAGIAVSGARDIAMGVAGAAMSVAGGLASAVAGRPSGSGSFGSSRTSFASGSTSWGSSSFSSSSTGPGSIYAANRDSALASANAAAEANVGQFIFVSAAELFPFQTDYVKSKRQAERMLLDPSAYGFSSVIMRPGLMYADSRPPTIPLAGVFSILSSLSSPIKSWIPRAADISMPVKPLHVDVVARAIVEVVESGGGSGVREVDEIEALGE